MKYTGIIIICLLCIICFLLVLTCNNTKEHLTLMKKEPLRLRGKLNKIGLTPEDEYAINYYLGKLRGISKTITNETDIGYIVTANDIYPQDISKEDKEQFIIPVQKIIRYLEENKFIHEGFKIIVNFTPLLESHSFPLYEPTRVQNMRQRNNESAILLPLYTTNLFNRKFIEEANNAFSTIPFEKRIPKAVWRGKLSGDTHGKRYMMINNQIDTDHNIGYTIIGKNSKNNFIPKREYKSITDMCKYKYILSAEGDRTDSGLIWKLLSGSVILMPIPILESWNQEFSLIPYTHFVPVKDNFIDLDEQIQWCEENPKKCKYIINNARKHANGILNLDHFAISAAILKRYADMYKLTRVDRTLRNNKYMDNRITDLQRWPAPKHKKLYSSVNHKLRQGQIEVYQGVLAQIRLRVNSLLEITTQKSNDNFRYWKNYFTNLEHIDAFKISDKKDSLEQETVGKDPDTNKYKGKLNAENLQEIQDQKYDIIIYSGPSSHIDLVLKTLWSCLMSYGTFILENTPSSPDTKLSDITQYRPENLKSITMGNNVVFLKRKV